jgi:transposase-like protein
MPDKKPRSMWKGKGHTEKPTCPHCGEDLRRIYMIKKCSTSKEAIGWGCRECQYQIWDKQKESE